MLKSNIFYHTEKCIEARQRSRNAEQRSSPPRTPEGANGGKESDPVTLAGIEESEEKDETSTSSPQREATANPAPNSSSPSSPSSKASSSPDHPPSLFVPSQAASPPNSASKSLPPPPFPPPPPASQLPSVESSPSKKRRSADQRMPLAERMRPRSFDDLYVRVHDASRRMSHSRPLTYRHPHPPASLRATRHCWGRTR